MIFGGVMKKQNDAINSNQEDGATDISDFRDVKLKVLEYLQKKSNPSLEDFEDDLDTDWGD